MSTILIAKVIKQASVSTLVILDAVEDASFAVYRAIHGQIIPIALLLSTTHTLSNACRKSIRVIVFYFINHPVRVN